MRNKLGFLISVSLKKKIKSKWFLIANIIIAILAIAVINIDSIITSFGGDFDKKIPLYVIDETESIKDSFVSNLTYYETNLMGQETSSFEIKEIDKSEDEIIELLKTEEKDSILIKIYNEDGNLKSSFTTLSTIDTYDYQLITSALQSSANIYIISSLGLTEEQYNKISSGIIIEREILDETITSDDENMEMIMTTVFPSVIFPFFMLTILLIQFVGSEINDEKSTKSMEIIISNVSPKTHLSAKIISNNLFIIGQIILVIIYGVIGFKIRSLIGGNTIVNGLGDEVSGIFETLKAGVLAGKFASLIVLTLILMILTFIAYSIIAAVLASMTTNAEDYQHVQAPLVFTLLIGYYLSIMAGVFDGSTLLKVLSFIPLISAVLCPSLFILGQIGIIEVMLSIGIMLIFILIIIKYGMRIYKEGILNYSSAGMWKKMFSSMKNKE